MFCSILFLYHKHSIQRYILKSEKVLPFIQTLIMDLKFAQIAPYKENKQEIQEQLSH